ncbi:hypothetical protein SLEP1_g22766 [Rubroshorea leprosula]|uniref:Uncharacterized protein n=1 Tax=Rubroshorea leprosula TaxID=152421 RepID=A0AAV5JFJ4_9ROSI|nr:hypothetical protein SLEP1_g22766 [Rubroshorea leprosula]
MSYEETVSVGGSEEVRALEYGDMGMTSESFDSERTKEGVGRSEVVGVEGDRVPITIVEVEGRRERYYDVDADIVSEVKQYEFELETKASLGYLVESYEISSGVLIRLAGVEERACSAPWDHWMLVYAHYLAAGLSAECIEATELYGPSALSEGVAIPKKSRKKSKTLTKEAGEVGAGKELVPSTSIGVEEKKRRVVEEVDGGNEVLQFVPRPPLVELDPELREFEVEGVETTTRARRFINATFLEVDKRQARDEALRYCGAIVVKHALESVSWVNGLTQEFMESVKDRSLLQRQKVKAKYPEVDIMKINFEGRTVFSPNFDFEFMAVEEEEAKVEETEVGAGVGGAEVDESQPPLQVEVHLVPSDDEQPHLPAKQQPT